VTATDQGDHESQERAVGAISGIRPARPVRILIADDHELVRQGMRTILSTEPDWVVCGEATTGRQALAMTLELQPDILITDIGLPEMNGLEVTRRVRSTLPVAVLIVTMHDDDQLVQEAIAAGASGYVLKMDAGRALRDAVRKILRHGRFFSERVHAPAERGSSGLQASARPGRSERLTSREREVLQLLAEGRSNKEIGPRLGISTKTVETHRARIMAKLEIHSMSELVRYAVRNRIIEP
jgi:DNA-binding NarL/FixJ family response regulator